MWNIDYVEVGEKNRRKRAKRRRRERKMKSSGEVRVGEQVEESPRVIDI